MQFGQRGEWVRWGGEGNALTRLGLAAAGLDG